IPRPPNAFFCFRSHFLEERRAAGALEGSTKFGGIGSQTSLSRTAAAEWNSMGKVAQRPFIRMALKKRREHAVAHPFYKYAPRKRVKR
ncbi:hypothetical protein C8J57DRAFT_1035514, partial [Mycena rebaudengoi]